MSEYRTSWRSRFGCLAVGVLVLLAPVVAYSVWVMVPPLPTTRFDASRWRSVVRSDDYARQDMVGSLIWSGRLEGLSRTEVKTMLGRDCECAYFTDWDLVYWLGPERNWMSLDSEWLVIRFGQDGRYLEHALVTD